jgi:hypothetical protein
MSSKTTPNWTQRPAEEYTPPNIVHTSKNTTLEVWTSMVITECIKQGYKGIFRPLELKHGWEFDRTPYVFVENYVSKARKEFARDI